MLTPAKRWIRKLRTRHKKMVQGLSIMTNPSAMIALQNLNKTNKQLASTQLKITSGLKINGPKDDSSTFQISTRLRGDISGLNAVKIALQNGDTTVSVAITAGKQIKDLLIEMKGKVIQSNQAGLDANSRTALHNDFRALADQITTIALTAEFNDANLIKSGATTFTVLSSQDGSTIAVSAASMDTTALAINASNLTTSASAAAARTAIDSAIVLAADKLAVFGAASKRVDVQLEFTGSLADILTEGLGNLVDADLANESARLQAFQIKQQLGVQALSIANSGPQTILGLFQ
jgi:flagellin